MNLKECIEEIITKNFKDGDYFDTHTVINLILQEDKYHLAYLLEFHEHYSNCDVSLFHGGIAKNIIGVMTDKVELVAKNAMTLNIYGGKPSPNALWRRIGK